MQVAAFPLSVYLCSPLSPRRCPRVFLFYRIGQEVRRANEWSRARDVPSIYQLFVLETTINETIILSAPEEKRALLFPLIN